MGKNAISGSFILKTLLEIYAKQNNLSLEYEADEESKTFTYSLREKENEKPSSVLAHRGRQVQKSKDDLIAV